MATIGTVQLALSETGLNATAQVTYTLNGSAQDVALNRSFIEVVELIGDDVGAGEDGISEPIPGGRVESVVSFPVQTLNRTRQFTVPISDINEDKGFNPATLLPRRDEIRATVTLRQLSASAVTGTSNEVRRGGFQL